MAYKVGQRFKLKCSFFDGEQYILAQVDTHQCALINLITGNRWRTPIQTLDGEDITEEEFKVICGDGVAPVLVKTRKKKENKK